MYLRRVRLDVPAAERRAAGCAQERLGERGQHGAGAQCPQRLRLSGESLGGTGWSARLAQRVQPVESAADRERTERADTDIRVRRVRREQVPRLGGGVRSCARRLERTHRAERDDAPAFWTRGHLLHRALHLQRARDRSLRTRHERDCRCRRCSCRQRAAVGLSY